MGTDSKIAPQNPDTLAERKLRGRALEGSDDKGAPDHADYEGAVNPDTQVRLDGEKDTLYEDGLDVGDSDADSDTLAGTRGPSYGIKP